MNCYFNPTEYSIAKTNTWNPEEVTGQSAPKLEFGGGQPRKMELSLLFDQTFPPYTMSVRDATALLLDAMDVPSAPTAGTPTAEPPSITFGWGRTVFKGACTSLTCTYKLFQPDGEPVRADVKLSLTQAEPPVKGQNPTTRAQAGFGMHTVARRGYVAVDLLRRVRRRDEVAADRRGERRRQPAAPAPRQLAVAPGAGGLMSATAQKSTERVAGVDVLVSGTPLDQKWRDAMIEVKVVDSLTLPDMALIRIADPHGDNVDAHPLQLGKDVEVKTAAMSEKSTTSIFKGQIAAVEPEFTQSGVVISVRAYDKSHKLNRQRKTRTFQQVSASDMVRKIAGEHGPVAQGRVDRRGPRVLPAEQRDRLGLRLAAGADARLRARRERHHDGVPPGQQGRPARRWCCAGRTT